MTNVVFEMKFCRRCGAKLQHRDGSAYMCGNGHLIFLNAATSTGVILFNDKNEVLILERAIDPGKGMLDIPGGFCNGAERLEDALARELIEEIGLEPQDYTTPKYEYSDIDMYNFGGEAVPTLTAIYSAHVTTGKQPVAGDDAAAILWIPLAEMPMQKIYFPIIKTALKRLQQT